ncbi:MAG: hypothetical protein CMM50_10870 [Rhodospirillaceae bacterium]|nr:hypothetical protein [Rhodospirillaceae bacterium]
MDTVAATQAQSTTNRPHAGVAAPDSAQGMSFLDLLFAAQSDADGTPFSGMFASDGSIETQKTISGLDPRGGDGMPAAHFLDMLLQGASPMAVAAGLTAQNGAGTASVGVTDPAVTAAAETATAPAAGTTTAVNPAAGQTTSAGTAAGLGTSTSTSTGKTTGGTGTATGNAQAGVQATGAEGKPGDTSPSNAAKAAGTEGQASQTPVQQAAAAAETAIVQAGGAIPSLPAGTDGTTTEAGVSVAAIAAGTTVNRPAGNGASTASTASNTPSSKSGNNNAGSATAGQSDPAKGASAAGLRAPEAPALDRPQAGTDYAALARADQAAFANAEAARQADAGSDFDRLVQGTHAGDAGRGALGGPPTVSGAATPRAVHIPVPPVNQVAVQIATAAKNGIDRISLQLDPAELGRIDVSLDIADDGHVTARVTADRPETLDMLQRDARGLEKALQDAGLKMDGNGLSFDLREQAEQQPSFAEHTGRGPSRSAEDGVVTADAGAVDAAYQYLDANRALDIRV